MEMADHNWWTPEGRKWRRTTIFRRPVFTQFGLASARMARHWMLSFFSLRVLRSQATRDRLKAPSPPLLSIFHPNLKIPKLRSAVQPLSVLRPLDRAQLAI